MALDAPMIEMVRAHWSPDIAADLRTIAMHSESDLIAFRDQVTCGAMDALELQFGGERIGSMIWSIANEHKGPVMVINALAARPVPGVCVVTDLHARFVEFAQASGCSGLRCWTKRAGLVRKLEKKQWARAAFVLELEF
jgi:hypothetical protein